MTLRVHAPHNVARLFKPTSEQVKKAILNLYDARPPFSYEPLYESVWQSLRLKESLVEFERIVGAWQPSVRRDSYLRALKPTRSFFDSFERHYEVDVLPRPYSIGRGLQAPFAPRMLCGTDRGPVVPSLLFWKDNPLTEEQTALYHSMVMDAFRSDPDLDSAVLMLVDTSGRALDPSGMPAVTVGEDIPLVSAERMRSMLDIFAGGYLMAKDELSRRARTEHSQKYREKNAPRPEDDQPGLF